MQELAKHGLLRKMDYLSTVSGGGYIGCCLASLLSMIDPKRKDTKKTVFSTEWQRFPLRNNKMDQDWELEDQAGFTPVQEVKYLRSRANFLIPRLLPFGADTLRAVGAVVVSALFPLTWFFALVFCVTGIYMGMVSHVLGTGEMISMVCNVEVLEITVNRAEKNLSWSASGQAEVLAVQDIKEKSCFASPLTSGNEGGKSYTQRAREAWASLARDSWCLFSSLNGHVRGMSVFLLLGMGWSALVLVLQFGFCFWWGEPVARLRNSSLLTKKRNFRTLSLATLGLMGGLFLFGSFSFTARGPYLLLIPTIFALGGMLFSLLVLCFLTWSSRAGDSRKLRDAVFRHSGMFVYALGIGLVLALLPGMIRAGNGLFIALFLSVVMPVVRYLLTSHAKPAIRKPVGRHGLQAKVKGWLLDGLVPVCTLLAVVAVGIVYKIGDNHWPMDDFSGKFIWLVWGGSLVVLGVLSLLDSNRLSVHQFYRDRLSETFLRTKVSETGKKPGAQYESVRDHSNIRLADFAYGTVGKEAKKESPPVDFGPYLLVNTTLNLTASYDYQSFQRQGEPFILSPCYVGSEETGYQPTKLYRDLTLGSAMTISGAALSPAMGGKGSLLTAFACTLLGVRLGRWLPNPAWPAGKKPGLELPVKWLVNEFCYNTHARDRLVYLSDGGHSGDNLGIIPLLQRQVKLLIVSDAECDPDYLFNSFNSSIRKAYVDLRIRIEIDLSGMRADAEGHTDSHFAMGRIHYPDKPDQKSGQKGWIIILKNSVSGDEIEPIRNYHRANPDFPHETTADQVFNEEQFESYSSLGRHLVKALMRGRVTPVKGNDSMETFIEEFCRYYAR